MVSGTQRLAENEFAEKAFTWEDEEFPTENIETLADHGFLGMNLDPKYGAAG